MQRHDIVIESAMPAAPKQPEPPPALGRLFLLTAIAAATLACTMLGPGQPISQRRIIRHHLPTLTPTSWLAPTQVVAAASEPVLAAPTPAPLSLPTVTPASPELAPAPAAAVPAYSQPTLNPLVVLNVRSGPSVDYPVLGKLAAGQPYQVSGKNPEGTWWQIVYPPGSGSLGWVSADSQYSSASGVEAVQIAQLPPPPPPTAIPTPVAVAQAPPSLPEVAPGQPTAAPGAPPPQLTPTPSLGDNPAAEPTATPLSTSPGWAFAGVRVYTDQDQGGLLLHGKAINNTGAAQELLAINGIFYDGQGQVIADKNDSYAYWPGYVIPPGGSVPFELRADGIRKAAKYDLSVEALSSDETPRQDFNVSNVNQQTEDDSYCLQGEFSNPGSELQDYLIIAAVLYDGQDNVLNFGDYEESGTIGGGDASNFEICIDRPNQDIARYEVVAWGR